ncbi:MAG: hypothetical protein ACJ72M_23635, partial [Propionibacteriaceae bacterium]
MPKLDVRCSKLWSGYNASGPKLNAAADQGWIGVLEPAPDQQKLPAAVTDEGVLSIHDFTGLGGGLIPMAKKNQSATVKVRPPLDSSLHTSQTIVSPARGQRFR